MAKSNKPYSDNKSVKAKKEMEYTTRIRVDKNRLNDYDSLDTSFLEGRLDKKVKNSRVAKEKLYKEKKHLNINFDLIGRILLLLGTLFIILFLISVLIKHDFFKAPISQPKEDTKVIEKEEVEKPLDDSYLFIGDFYTERFNFDDLDYHYVKECNSKYTTEDILGDIKNKIYLYNPSVVFIQLGINDLNNNKQEEEIIDNIGAIIDGIKDNRPYAKIYVESIYPINKDVDDYDDDILDDEIDNDLIISLNKEIKKLTEEKKVDYLDVFSFVSEEDKLNEEYTDNGIYLNDEGYKRILKEIKRVVE
ncbi:MAG: hypothetical protein IJI22_04060 [Bacilli bacterium]|nr:hypothetical protein [Bacilli bacterium]